MKAMRLEHRLRDTAEELWSLQHASYRVETQRIGVPDLPPLLETVGDIQESELAYWGCRDEEEELVGAVSVERDGGVFTVCRLMVRPDRFREGIASRLLAALFDEHPEARSWEVTAEARNLPAISLYEKHGFRCIETFKPRDDIFMVRLRRRSGRGSPPRP